MKDDRRKSTPSRFMSARPQAQIYAVVSETYPAAGVRLGFQRAVPVIERITTV
jgi:hypothetical protein